MHKKFSLLATMILFFPAFAFAATCYGPSDCLPGQSCVLLQDGRSLCRTVAPPPSFSSSSSSAVPMWTENPEVLEWEFSSSSSISSTSSTSSESSRAAVQIIEDDGRDIRDESDRRDTEENQPMGFTEPMIFQRAKETSGAPEDIANAAAQALEDENIEDVTVTPEGVSMRIRSRARFLGFIPLPYTLQLSMHTDGTVTRKKPWWTFFTAENEGAIIAELNAGNDNLENDSPTGLLARMVRLMREVVGGE